jgi:hypothetical protein
MDVEEARQVAVAIVGKPIIGAATAGGGGNSRLFRIEAADGRRYALKLYPPRGADPRDRIGAEAGALRFLHGRGIDTVPALIGVDTARNCALLSWVKGGKPEPVGDSDVGEALSFLAELHAARRDETASILPEASEACLTAAELVTQVERRFARLTLVADHHTALGTLMHRDLLPALRRARTMLEDGYTTTGMEVAARVTATTLSPSDFGFHNALRDAQGRLVFIDFEYFGWDDPVKLVADTALHPRNDLPPTLRKRLSEGMEAIYEADDPSFRRRLSLLYPLFGLRWCAILLNEFLPEKWAVRAHAGAAVREAAETRQLAKAQALFETLSRDHEQFAPAF